MSTKTTDLRQPEMAEFDGHKQWNCRWPGCEFDTLDEAQWREHINPLTGAHREPLGLPGVSPQPLGADERAELAALRAFKEATEDKIATGALVRATTTTTTTTAPPKGDKTKGD